MFTQRSRTEIATLISERLAIDAGRMRAEFSVPGRINSTWIDDLLPADLAGKIYDSFPPTDRMMLKSSIKENKHVAAQMDQYGPLLEETVYAFQDARVLDLI